MKIALAQINTKVGDIKNNALKVLNWTCKARRAGADLVVFPEMTLTGYPPLDLVEEADFVECNLRALRELTAKITAPACIVGYVDKNLSGRGKPLLNCAALLTKGKMLAGRAKTLLPTYDVFDEARYFEPSRSNAIIRFRGINLGLTICEDIWNIEGILSSRLYRTDPAGKLLRDGAQLMLNLSCSPYHRGKVGRRFELLKTRAADAGVPFIYCNCVGANDELIFDGNSLVSDGRGRIIARAKAFEEDLVTVDLDAMSPEIKLPEMCEEEEVTRALILGIRDYARKCGFSTAALGLSGGIDSAVVAVLAARALGPKNVTGVSMPSPYTSQASKKDTETLASNLGINFLTLPISRIYRSYLSGLPSRFNAKTPGIMEQNIQARIRGNLLMALSNRLGHLVLSTGNKSETAMGYCTLYGDMSGGLSVISDVLKTTVYAIARNINAREEIIPRRIISRPPSAELRPGQNDQDDLPPYETLDPIIRSYVEEGKDSKEISNAGFSKTMVKNILDRIDRNEYKRRQAAPGLKVSPKAFGCGRRIPLARGYYR
ncbi:MAG: NAD+ synthase [bacterium]